MDKWKKNPFEDLFGNYLKGGDWEQGNTQKERVSSEDIRQATEATSKSGLIDDGARRHFYDTFLEARKARNLNNPARI